jgi:uncharacterized membrane protein
MESGENSDVADAGGPVDDPEEIEDIVDDLEELEERSASHEERRVLRRTIQTLDRISGGRIFGVDDLAQQIVGGFVLSAPFVVTEEVWTLAGGMSWFHGGVTVLMVLLVGYGTLYGADHDRDPDREASVAGVPLRYVSLLFVSYLSVTILAVVFDAPTTFGSSTETTLRAVSIGSIFAVIGAATADSLF